MEIKIKVKEATAVKIATPSIKLDGFLKLCGAVSTGGQAKMLIQDGQVRVNGEILTKRGKTLVAGDKIALGNGYWQIVT
ncbi:MAG: RNA-binding S4 domain-containing protein [Oscillospiraceae bacterium]|nr:RNA-binding S4 domain-containing protein [Oscillospiraceae bacterium]